jgi:hypothetical protein
VLLLHIVAGGTWFGLDVAMAVLVFTAIRDESGGWRRIEPWICTIVNAASGQVLGIIDGRDSATVGGWLALRSPKRIFDHARPKLVSHALTANLT